MHIAVKIMLSAYEKESGRIDRLLRVIGGLLPEERDRIIHLHDHKGVLMVVGAEGYETPEDLGQTLVRLGDLWMAQGEKFVRVCLNEPYDDMFEELEFESQFRPVKREV